MKDKKWEGTKEDILKFIFKSSYYLLVSLNNEALTIVLQYKTAVIT